MCFHVLDRPFGFCGIRLFVWLFVWLVGGKGVERSMPWLQSLLVRVIRRLQCWVSTAESQIVDTLWLVNHE